MGLSGGAGVSSGGADVSTGDAEGLGVGSIVTEGAGLVPGNLLQPETTSSNTMSSNIIFFLMFPPDAVPKYAFLNTFLITASILHSV